MSDGCISSPNFPDSHERDDSCRIEITPAWTGFLHVEYLYRRGRLPCRRRVFFQYPSSSTVTSSRLGAQGQYRVVGRKNRLFIQRLEDLPGGLHGQIAPLTVRDAWFW